MNPTSQPKSRFQKKRKKDATITITTQSTINSLHFVSQSSKKDQKESADNSLIVMLIQTPNTNQFTKPSYCAISMFELAMLQNKLGKGGRQLRRCENRTQSQLAKHKAGLTVDICWHGGAPPN
jgi:hypothetical protein